MLDPRDIAPETPRSIRRVEYEKMVELGLFADERVELLYGVIINMSPKGTAHDASLDRLTELLVLAVHRRAKVRIQSAFAASDGSEPEPDLAVVPRRDYDDAHPDEADLVVEVAEASLVKDRGVKARLYAESCVPECWVVNLVDRVIEVSTQPTEGGYASMTTHAPGDVIQLQRFADVQIRVSDVLPKG